MVVNKDTDIEKCIEIALSQYVNEVQLKEIFRIEKIKRTQIDMKEKPIKNKCNFLKEIDVGSCDRFALLYNMLKGSYTESNTKYGNYQSDIYEFIPDISIVYDLKIEDYHFLIKHSCAFINNIKTRIIPIQDDSQLAKN